MGLDSFSLFNQIEEYEDMYEEIGWIGNPAEELFPYENENEEVNVFDF